MGPRSQRHHLDYQRAVTLLTAAILDAGHQRKLRKLLEGLLTPAQCVDLAQRLRIAHFLSAGYSYGAIRDETGGSTTTIAAVHRWLKEKNPSYRRVYPIRRRRSRSEPQRTYPDRDLPFSIKAFTRRALGT